MLFLSPRAFPMCQRVHPKLFDESVEAEDSKRVKVGLAK